MLPLLDLEMKNRERELATRLQRQGKLNGKVESFQGTSLFRRLVDLIRGFKATEPVAITKTGHHHDSRDTSKNVKPKRSA